MPSLKHIIPTIILISHSCRAEYRNYDHIAIPADSNFISYAEGFLVAPGYLDTKDLVFEVDYQFAPKGRGGDRLLQVKNVRSRKLDQEDGGSFVDTSDMFNFENGLTKTMPVDASTEQLIEDAIKEEAEADVISEVLADDDSGAEDIEDEVDSKVEEALEAAGASDDQIEKTEEMIEDAAWEVAENVAENLLDDDEALKEVEENKEYDEEDIKSLGKDAEKTVEELVKKETEELEEDLEGDDDGATLGVDSDEGNDTVEVPSESKEQIEEGIEDAIKEEAELDVVEDVLGKDSVDDEVYDEVMENEEEDLEGVNDQNYDEAVDLVDQIGKEVANNVEMDMEEAKMDDDVAIKEIEKTKEEALEAIGDDDSAKMIESIVEKETAEVEGDIEEAKEEVADDDDNNGKQLKPVDDQHTTGGQTISSENKIPEFADSSVVELAFFTEPEGCAKAGICDWTELGVGASNSDGDLRWCCNSDAVALGLCEPDPSTGVGHGRLIIDKNKFKGSYLAVHVPSQGIGTVGGKGLMRTEQTGNHILVLANCGNGSGVLVSGTSIWKSDHGYLPGDLFGEMEFFFAVTVLYLLLLGWYGYSMNKYAEHTIPIQKWFIITILLGFTEVLFKTGDYFIWNEDGVRMMIAMYIGVLMGVLKRGASRGLILMVSLGWGIVRDSLGGKFRKIMIFCIIYIVTSGIQDILTALAVTDPDLSTQEDVKIIDVVTVLTFIVFALDLSAYVWILNSLNGTVRHLEQMGQNQKLRIMMRLRHIFIFSILFAVFWSVFIIVDSTMKNPLIERREKWAVRGAWEVNYYFVLLFIAILWRPNDRAKEMAYAMELPTNGMDQVEFHTNDGLPEDDELDNGVEHYSDNNEFGLSFASTKQDRDELDALDEELEGFEMGRRGNGLT